MRWRLQILVPVGLVAALLVVPGAASGDAGASRLKRCPTPRGFTTGPFFADQVRARGVSCRTARAQVKRWGRTRDCVYPDGPNKVCRAGRYRCVTREIPGFEGARATCKRGKRRAVGFRFGS